MSAYVLRRVLGSLGVAIAGLTAIFVMTRLAPGDPAQTLLGSEADPAQVTAMRHQMGLDQPFVVQYVQFIGHALRGDFGTSYYTHQPAINSVLQRIPVTAELALLTILVSVGASALLALRAARRRNSRTDATLRVGAVIGLSIPGFWLGLLLILLFGLYIPGLLPASGWTDPTADPVDNLYHCVLPVAVLSIPTTAILFRSLRVSMLDVVNRDYVTYAQAMGLSEGRVMRRIALPNAVVPTATVAGLLLGYLMGGSIIVETVFSIPGLGQLLVYSFGKRDFPVATAAVFSVAVGFIVINLVVDIVYAYLNPRIRELYSRRVKLAEA
jgi:peptide/nickel transport system permease protein